MNLQYTPYTLPLLTAALLSLALAGRAWLRRDSNMARSLTWLMLSIFIWTLGYAFELSNTNMSRAIFWGWVQYLGIPTSAFFWLIFVLHYTDRQNRLTFRNLAIGWAGALGSMILAWTNRWHHLVWADVAQATSTTNPPYIYLDITHGSGFFVIVAYAYLLMALGVVVLVRAYLASSSTLYRKQIGVMLVGATPPWIGNFLYISGLNPFPHLDLTPLALALTGFIGTWGLFRYRLLDILPVARDRLIESMSEAVIVLDAMRRIVDLNPAAQRLIGPASVTAIGQPAAQVLYPWGDLIEAHHDLNDLNSEFSLNRPDGMHHFELHLTPLRDRRSQLAGRLVIVRDITERVETESELRQARETAEAASRAKSTFLANMSHELRTPLAVMIGYTEIVMEQIKMGKDISKVNDRLEKVRLSGRQLLILIDNVLEYSRLDSGAVILNHECFNLSALLKDVVSIVSFTAEKNGNRIEIETNGSGAALETWGDQMRLRQILISLLDNAAKFTENGLIRLSAEQEIQHGQGWLTIRVSDTGIGMTPEQRDELFAPFTQGDASSTRRYSGTGLGLALSRRLCKAMGGELSVDSSPQHGSIFTVRLPVKEQAEITVQRKSAQAAQEMR